MRARYRSRREKRETLEDASVNGSVETKENTRQCRLLAGTMASRLAGGFCAQKNPRSITRRDVFGLREIPLFRARNGAAPVVTLAPILFANLASYASRGSAGRWAIARPR